MSGGRPEIYVFDNDTIELIIDERCRGNPWNLIANTIDVPIRTLERWRQKSGFQDPLRRISDDELCVIIACYLAEHINIGEVFTAGYLLSLNLYVPRDQLRRVIDLVDPEGILHRKTHRKLKSRAYNIVDPHRMWHIDGHHALDRWGLITHGCIDGATRVVLYLLCADNNLPSTPLKPFIEACKSYQVPLCVR